MIFILEKESVDDYLNLDEIKEVTRKLDEGKYLVKFIKVDEEKTKESYREHYFALLTTCQKKTGMSKDDIHTLFKKEQNIDSTIEFEIQDWIRFIQSFKEYVFAKLDMII